MPQLVSRKHVQNLRHHLLRVQQHLMRGEKSQAEQVAIDHMGMTDKGWKYLEENNDGVSMDFPEAYALIHRHFRDITYAHLEGRAIVEKVLEGVDKQIARYEAFLAEHDVPSVPNTVQNLPVVTVSHTVNPKLLNTYFFVKNMKPILAGDSDDIIVAGDVWHRTFYLGGVLYTPNVKDALLLALAHANFYQSPIEVDQALSNALFAIIHPEVESKLE